MSRPTQFHLNGPFVYRAITFYGWSFQDHSTRTTETFGLVPVRSPLLRESRLISFPPGTEIFQFSGLASTPYIFRCR